VRTSLAEVLRRFGPAYLQRHGLSTAQARAWRAIVACRTPALGGQRLRCDGCAAEAWRWHSCRNRHCPRCGTRQREAWRAARMAELLNVPYAHLVFTLPHELNTLAATQARWVYGALLRCVAATLEQFAADERWLGGIGGFTLVLHTWTQDLRRHPHVHALMACGALGRDGAGAPYWVEPKRSPRFLFPVHALSRVFRAKFVDALRRAEDEGALPRDPAATPMLRKQRRRALWAHAWVVYAKAPPAGPAALLDYLSRYTQRTAIGAERIVAIRGDQVLLRVRADASGGKRVIAIDGVQFIARLLQHVLPAGLKRIRHYGLLAPAAKAERLALARKLLAMPAPNPRAAEDARAFMQRVAAIDIERCPHCRIGRWCCVQTIPADRSALAAIAAACRGPP
jgi:hypothetical protein